jgi:hypothetical protein
MEEEREKRRGEGRGKERQIFRKIPRKKEKCIEHIKLLHFRVKISHFQCIAKCCNRPQEKSNEGSEGKP